MIAGIIDVVVAIGAGLGHIGDVAMLLLGALLFGGGRLLVRSAKGVKRLSRDARTVTLAILCAVLVGSVCILIRSAGSGSAFPVVAPCALIATTVLFAYLLTLHPSTRSAYANGLASLTPRPLDHEGPGPLLAVENLTVTFPTADGLVHAVRGLSFELHAGETLGIVGESGSGKSVSMLTLMGLTAGADISGSALFKGVDLVAMRDRQLRELRGAEIGMVFQDPLSSLHPHYRVGWQIVEAIQAHSNDTQEEARARAIELLKQVGIPQPEKRIDNYPHELSGGMRQRVMIAMSLALDPSVLIADEPTTALDATVQAQILELMEGLQTEFGMALIMITHDLGVIAEIADRVVVMYAGRSVESADRHTLYYRPHHPYTLGLLGSIPSSLGGRKRLRPIVGQPPSLINLPGGCAFHPRCPYAMDRCLADDPDHRAVAGSSVHTSACWLPPELVGTGVGVNAERARYAARHRTGKAGEMPGVRAATEVGSPSVSVEHS